MPRQLPPIVISSEAEKSKSVVKGNRSAPEHVSAPWHHARAPLGLTTTASSNFWSLPTLVAVRHNEVLREFYTRFLASGKLKKVALTACMRKLLTIFKAMLLGNPNMLDFHNSCWAMPKDWDGGRPRTSNVPRQLPPIVISSEAEKSKSVVKGNRSVPEHVSAP